ncbi:MAG: hypothetical protein ACI94D_001526 [Neolewinella sp.]|jgi:hypothetical protein
MGVGKKHYLDISIATVHPAGLASSDKDPDCCLDRTEMSYISRAFDAGVPLVNLIPPVSSQLNLQVDAASFIRTRANTTFDFLQDRLGRYFTQYEFGTGLATQRFDRGKCQLEPGSGEVGPIGELTETTDGGNNKISNDFESQKNTLTQYRYFTIDGKLLATEQSFNPVSELQMRRYLEDLGLPAGIYLVHGIHNNSPIIRKIHLNR